MHYVKDQPPTPNLTPRGVKRDGAELTREHQSSKPVTPKSGPSSEPESEEGWLATAGRHALTHHHPESLAPHVAFPPWRAAARRRTVEAPRFSELYAARDNVHEFVAGPEGACVLDVLSPPYDAAGGRDCHYVRVVRADGAAATLELYADGAEPDFTCLSAPYGGLDPS